MWPTLCVSVDGSFLVSSPSDKELVRPFRGVCALIKITLQKHKRSEQIRLGRDQGEFIGIGILEGVQGYGHIYKVNQFNFTTHIVLSVIGSGGAANIQA